MDTQSTSEPPPPIALVKDDDPQLLEAANRKVPQKSRLSRFLSLPHLRSRPKSLDSEAHETPPETDPQLHISGIDATPISLDNSALLGQDIYADRYEWAVLYENQRGSVVSALSYP